RIVITDIRMPGMNGLEVLEAVKKLDPDIEVIVCTAFAEMDLAIQALQLDASDFITKPISDHALHLSLERAKQRYTSRKKLQDYAIFLERQAADQAQILHQDKMMSLGRLAASVVHEINNPLSGILNYSRLMSKILKKGPLEKDKSEKFKQYLELVETETERCAQIVSNLLAFSRKAPPAMGPVQSQELLQKCTSLSHHKLELQNIALTTSFQPNLPAIQGDANQLQQCIINLIFNAIDTMPEGGNLHIKSHHADKTHVTIAITDTGAGIPENNLPHIFEPFFTTKQEGYGVGLGLSTVYGIIEHHNGKIDVKSQPGKGTTFFIRLPVTPADSS
ncbi:MAG: ATP-binding protein, partial [Desulfobacterales bacterium]|nr:ATP-binding protein [Desulfobacterales bacterium]MDX2512335.1 ATP-binding protein [Desulfobacterales bacterium]